jgi:RNA polymerase sigma-70 factor (ECF subfamily)
MLTIIRRYLPREQDAEDALQDALLNVWKSIQSFHGEARLSTWLHRVAVNAALMRLRTRRRRPETFLDGHELRAAVEVGAGESAGRSGDGDYAALDLLLQQELRTVVRGELERLPEDCRIVVRLRDIEGMDLQDISLTLGLKLSTVKTRLHRGRVTLRQAVDRHIGTNAT